MSGPQTPPGAATPWRLALEPAPDEDLRRAVMAPLLAYNTAVGGASGHALLALSLRQGAEGPVQGGLWGVTAHGWLYIQMLVVPEAARGHGLGRQLVQVAEAQALARGCRQAWVDTQFGARGFYEALGYRVFGELPDYPPGFTRSFLRKALCA